MDILGKSVISLTDDGTLSYRQIASAFALCHTLVIENKHSHHLNAKNIITQSKLLSLPAHPDDKNIILFTSGSSGQPKAVVLSFNKILKSAELFCHWVNIKSSSRLMSLAPASSMSGIRARYFIPLSSRCNLIDDFNLDTSIFGLLNIIEKNSVSHLIVGPPFIKQLAMLASKIEKTTIASIQYILCTGANIDVGDVLCIWDKLKIKVLNYYGLTETYGFCIATSPVEFNPTFNSVGRAISGVQLELINSDKNGIGQLRIHSSRLFSHYVGSKPNQSEFFDTGDYASIDLKGNVFLHGRIDHALKLSSTELIYPITLENILSACLNGKPIRVYSTNRGFGAWIETEKNIAEIMQTLKQHLSAKYIPSEIKVVIKLPCNPLGKVTNIKD